MEGQHPYLRRWLTISLLFLPLGTNVSRSQRRGDPLLQDVPTTGVPALPRAAHPQRPQNHTRAQCLPGPQGEDPASFHTRTNPHSPSHASSELLASSGPAVMPTSFLPPQDKLTKSLTYILGNQDTVQTQICELEETVRHTEVRGGHGGGPGPCPAVGAGRG